jgi:Lsr2
MSSALPGPTTFVVQHQERHHKLKLTIDSAEALEDTLRVVGALYNVTLTVSAKPAAGTGSSASSSATPRASTATSRAPRKGQTAQKRTRPASRRARSAANGRGRVDTATVRAWARDNGYEIAGRGRVPATVLTAYQQSGVA